LTERLAAAGLEPMRLTTVTLTEAIVGLAEAGEAVSIVPRVAATAAVHAVPFETGHHPVAVVRAGTVRTLGGVRHLSLL